jgi:ribosomal protein S14
MEQLQDGGVWTELVPTKEATAEYAARGLLERVISRTGAPAWIVSDQGKAFTGDIIKELCSILRIKKIQTTAFHPQRNGATERVHRDLNKFLKQFVNTRQDDWDVFLPAFEIVRRASDIRGTGVSQSPLRFGKELELPTELLHNGGRNAHEDAFRYIDKLRAALAQSQAVYSSTTEKQKRKDAKTWKDAMVKYQEREHEVGDYVMLYTPTCADGLRPKLTTMWRGPYEIIAKPSPVNYTIRHLLLAGKPVQTVYAHRLKRYCPRNDGNTQVAEHERAQALDLELADQQGEVLGIAAEKVVDQKGAQQQEAIFNTLAGLQPPSRHMGARGSYDEHFRAHPPVRTSRSCQEEGQPHGRYNRRENLSRLWERNVSG